MVDTRAGIRPHFYRATGEPWAPPGRVLREVGPSEGRVRGNLFSLPPPSAPPVLTRGGLGLDERKVVVVVFTPQWTLAGQVRKTSPRVPVSFKFRKKTRNLRRVHRLIYVHSMIPTFNKEPVEKNVILFQNRHLDGWLTRRVTSHDQKMSK